MIAATTALRLIRIIFFRRNGSIGIALAVHAIWAINSFNWIHNKHPLEI